MCLPCRSHWSLAAIDVHDKKVFLANSLATTHRFVKLYVVFLTLMLLEYVYNLILKICYIYAGMLKCLLQVLSYFPKFKSLQICLNLLTWKLVNKVIATPVAGELSTMPRSYLITTTCIFQWYYLYIHSIKPF